jgi:hypothetical protein
MAGRREKGRVREKKEVRDEGLHITWGMLR